MPAPDIATLYDFETAYEDALANYIGTVNATWQVLTPRSNINVDTIVVTPRVTIEFSITGTGEQREIQNNVEYYADRRGMFTIQAVSGRNDPAQNHGQMRGAIRQAMLGSQAVFNANSVPYYQTIDLSEGGSSQSVNAENDEILTQLTYPIWFSFMPSAYP